VDRRSSLLTELLAGASTVIGRAILVACAALIATAAAEEMALSAEAAYAAILRGRLILIDVRSPDEWQATGTPSGATRISIEQSFDDRDFVDQVLYQVNHDRAVAIALICSGEERARRGARLLETSGFADVRWVREGVRARQGQPPGWIELGLPVDP
jgi:rhodanese-related sulfurtransferase